MALNALGQIALRVSNVERSAQFYRETIGLRELFRFGNLIFFDCAGVRLMLEGSAKPYRAADPTCHYFKVTAIDAEFERLRAVGVAFEGTPHLIAKMPDHELWMAFFRDPDGHMLALMEERR